MREESKGTLYCLIEAFLSGLLPVFVFLGVKNLPALGFAAVSSLLGAIAAFAYLLVSGKIAELKNKKAYESMVLVALCIVIIPYSLLFIGAKHMSGVNVAILGLVEVVTTLIFTHYIGEKTTRIKIASSVLILLGAVLVMWQKGFQFNFGDVLIVLSTFFYPIGNFHAKKALNYVTPATILTVRFFLGAIFLGLLALIFEGINLAPFVASTSAIVLVLANGLIVFGFGKVFWYEGMKRVDITKAISIVMTYPLFALIFLIGFLDEKVTLIKAIGIAVMLVGLYLSILRQSTKKSLTKYAS